MKILNFCKTFDCGKYSIPVSEKLPHAYIYRSQMGKDFLWNILLYFVQEILTYKTDNRLFFFNLFTIPRNTLLGHFLLVYHPTSREFDSQLRVPIHSTYHPFGVDKSIMRPVWVLNTEGYTLGWPHTWTYDLLHFCSQFPENKFGKCRPWSLMDRKETCLV